MLLSGESLNWAERVERGTGGSFVFLILFDFDLIRIYFISFTAEAKIRRLGTTKGHLCQTHQELKLTLPNLGPTVMTAWACL